MSKIELLKILDMDSDNQFWAIQKYLPKDLANLYDTQEVSLADIAFKLRDEFVLSTPYSNRYAYNNAFEIVYEYEKEARREGTDKTSWGLDWSQPIHWVIAALIAKEK